jgi:hypothetical protein
LYSTTVSLKVFRGKLQHAFDVTNIPFIVTVLPEDHSVGGRKLRPNLMLCFVAKNNVQFFWKPTKLSTRFDERLVNNFNRIKHA